MKYIFLLLVLFSLGCQTNKEQKTPLSENKKEFNDFISHFENEFVYYDDKKDIFDCIKLSYSPYADTLKSAYEKVMFYEEILNELYDTHVNLNTNTGKSYRLSAPIYVVEKEGVFYVKNVFTSRLATQLPKNIIDSQVISFNSVAFPQMIQEFPTKCHDKNDAEIKEWLANKIFAGRRNEPRIVQLKSGSGDLFEVDIDALQFKNESSLLTVSRESNIGIIKINNALGNSDLVPAFNEALDKLMDTKALILDLRNTPGGGNTSVAEPIMGRFISKKQGYQICESKNERYTKQVSPKGKTYTKPLYVLAGRWTGSMGEGMTIGLDGMNRGTIVGTELNRLAGGMKNIKFRNSKFKFNLSFEKMYHLDGSLRETFVPEEFVNQDNVLEDEFLAHAIGLIDSK